MTSSSDVAATLQSKLSFSTLGCPDWTWNEILEFGPRFGFAGVEIRLLAREVDLLACAEFQPSRLSASCNELRSAGLQVCGLASSVRFHDPDPQVRRNHIETGKRYLELAVELDAGFVRVFGDVIPEDARLHPDQIEASLCWIADGLNQLGEFAFSCQRQIAIETHGDFADSLLMERLMQKVYSPAIGVLWDTHHPWRFFGEEIGSTFERLKRWTFHTHWKDSLPISPENTSHENVISHGGYRERIAADLQARELMSGHRPSHYVLMGEGEFPTSQALKLLIEHGYTGWLSLEWEKMWHPELADPQIAFPAFVRQLYSALSRF
ncbi:MAG: sugar phosphate isomerase/epimerase family protein [Planctomycetaceae bacterium]